MKFNVRDIKRDVDDIGRVFRIGNEKLRKIPDWFLEAKEPSMLYLTIPSGVTLGSSFALTVEVGDQHGATYSADQFGAIYDIEKPVKLSLKSDVDVSGLPEEVEIPVDKGLTRIDGLRVKRSCVCRISAVSAEYGLHGRSNPIDVQEREGDLKLYWGDLHSHIRERRAQALISSPERTIGPATVEEALTFAKEYSALDFCALTDHDFSTTYREWEDTNRASDEFSKEGEFIAFPGYEWGANWNRSHLHGHRCVIYKRSGYPMLCAEYYDTPQKLHRALDGKDEAIIIPHHTQRPDIYLDWDSFDPSVERLVEVYQIHGSSEKAGDPYSHSQQWGVGGYFGSDEAQGHFIQDGLSRGYKFGMTGGSECHDGRIGRPRHHGLNVRGPKFPNPGGITGVWAKDLTRDSIWEALWNRRTYGTTEVRIVVKFMVNGIWMGGETELSSPRNTRRIWASILGTNRIKEIVIVKNNEDWQVIHGKDDEEKAEIEDTSPARTGDYYYLRITQEDGNMAWTSPVWINVKK